MTEKNIVKKLVNKLQESKNTGFVIFRPGNKLPFREPNQVVYTTGFEPITKDGHLVGLAEAVYEEDVFCGYDHYMFSKQSVQILRRAGF